MCLHTHNRLVTSLDSPLIGVGAWEHVGMTVVIQLMTYGHKRLHPTYHPV